MTEASLAQRLAQLSPQQRAQLSSRLRDNPVRPRPEPIPVLDRSSGRLPMSSAQRRLYFLQKLQPDSAAYNNVEAVRLRGRLDLGALQAAVTAVLARHEVLRTTCGDDDGQPRLLAAHPADAAQRLRVEVVDASPPAPPGGTDAVLAAAADRPFDLDAEFPLRVLLVREADDEHVLLLVVHHIASDAWSCRLLVAEFFAAYARAVSGDSAGQAPPGVQYADFAAWQSAGLVDGDLAGHLSYWRERLAGLAPVLELPLEQPRPAVRRDRGAEIHFDLDQQTRRRLHAVARDAAVTPFALLLTAFGFVLHRHCATEDLAVAVPVSGRERVDIEQLIGCFINTVVLRLDLSALQTCRDLVRRLWSSTLHDLEHQSLPFEHLVAELNPQRDLSAGQLVQVMFNHYPATEAPTQVPGLQVAPVDVSRARAKFDLTCTVVDHGDRLRLTLNHATDLLDGATARRIGEHTVAVLATLLDDLDAPMAALPPVPPHDTDPRDHRTTPAADPVPVLRRFESHAHADPDRVAVQTPDEHITYGDLNRRAAALAAYLAGQGARSQPVGLLFERSVDYVVAMLAALKAGRTYLPLDPVMPPPHLAAVLHAADAGLVLTHAHVDTAALAQAAPHVEIAAVERLPPGSATTAAGADEAMYVLFTSGSTGAPKGVVVEHRHFAAYLTSIIDRMALPDGLNFALVSTLAADLGLTNVYGALATGGTLHLLPYEWAADPPRFADYFRTHHIDVMKLVPSHLQAVADAGLLPDVVPARHLVLAGEACTWDLAAAAQAARPGCVVWNQYGPTETTVSVLAYRVPDPPPVPRGVTVPLGFPLDHVGVHVVDAQLRPLPRGAAGELLITGGSVARGYLHPGSPDQARFIRDPFRADPRARAYRSGDRARIRADGSVEFLGRLDRQVKIRGYRVEPAHIEAVLRRHPGIADVAVAARTDHGYTTLAAYYVTVPGVAPQPPLPDFARAAMPAYLVPAAFVALDRLPLTPNGKLDWRALPAPERQPTGDQPATPPRHARDADLARIWCDVLGLDRVGIDDDFFACGGDSFSAMRVARRVGDGMRVVSLFQHPTIRRLADFLGRADTGGYLHRLPGATAGTATATAAVVAVPFGGATAAAYAELARALPAQFPLYAVELPGHDPADPARPLEPFDTIAARCTDEIRRTITGPITVYGHCVGAALAYDIARRLAAEGAPVTGVVLGGAFPRHGCPAGSSTCGPGSCPATVGAPTGTTTTCCAASAASPRSSTRPSRRSRCARYATTPANPKTSTPACATPAPSRARCPR
ncbi:non-ribosomal peptide synthetase [Catellatospora tritici]|uniref:non-ribosomal peptide synthetase n=1 Tax=Catellatospora tritici TaxID=2851566 RepID=UPI001C2D0F3F|nr:non-ribosomal peptide synthetase [Catellatospora tritici]MBV1850505.1 amino acid adenylation domain-containing protein [Catellatospora tritici]